MGRWGDSRSDGNQMTLTQSDKWLRQAGVIDGWEVTTTDTAIFFRSGHALIENFTNGANARWLNFLPFPSTVFD